MEANLDQCPLCGTELSQTKYREIRAKLKAEQEKTEAELAEAKIAMKQAVEQESRVQFQEQLRAMEKKIRGESEQSLKRALANQEQLTGKLKAAEARETQIRKEAQTEIERQKQTIAKKAGDEARKEAQAEIDKLAAERDSAAKQLAQAKERESQIRKQIEQQAERQHQKDLSLQREALEKDRDSALSKQQAQFNRVRESLEKQVNTLQRKVHNNTANELGDSGEIDVFDVLRDAFKGDVITRVQKGQPGADIRHEVMYKGESCGIIVTDSKNRQGWQNAYVTKLRQDQMEAGAEHAILATTVFPADKNHICIESGVIVISPQHVVHIVQLIRQAMIAAHIKGLSIEQRGTKMGRLYALITSEVYVAKFAEATRLTEDVLELDVQEKKAHDNTWRKRGTLVKRMQNVLREIDTDVASIVEDDHRPKPSTLPFPKGVAVGLQGRAES